MDFLLFGGRGWIGEMLCKTLEEQEKSYYCSSVRLENREEVEREIEKYKPKRVISTAGKTGRPNVDWCEDNKIDTLRSNVLGILNLADVCYLRGLHLTNLASGCIYFSLEKVFTEEDEPNFTGSYYSFTKVQAEKCLSVYNNVLTLRLRMPISDDLSARSFIKKIATYDKVVDVPNSMSVLYDLLPILVDMSERDITGVYNFCNPGFISHNEILSMYKEIIDPNFTWKNFSLEEQAKILKAPRSNCLLDTTKLESLYCLPPIHETVRKCLLRIKEKEFTPEK